MRKRIIRMVATFCAAIQILALNVCAISAEKAILMDAQTGRVIYQKNSDSKALIASTTKIMTALIICEQCNVLDRVRIPREAVGIEGSSMYLKEGEILTVQELLYGLMLHSGNDAAVALAIYCAGTVEGFAELMNDKAHLLGMDQSHFVNPNGLDSPDHYSTARDMAVLACYAMENPIFRKTVSTKQITIGERILRNHNKLLWQVEGADGVKTGYTKAAGRILVSSAERHGRRLVAVTINDPADWRDHAELMELGFKRYQITRIIESGSLVASIEIIGGKDSSVDLIAASDFYYPLAEEEIPNFVVSAPQFVYAPVSGNQEACYGYVCLSGNVIGKVQLVYAEDIPAQSSERNSIMKRLQRALT